MKKYTIHYITLETLQLHCAPVLLVIVYCKNPITPCLMSVQYTGGEGGRGGGKGGGEGGKGGGEGGGGNH